MFFLNVFIVLVSCFFLPSQITQLQFDWNELECTIKKKHDFSQIDSSYIVLKLYYSLV